MEHSPSTSTRNGDDSRSVESKKKVSQKGKSNCKYQSYTEFLKANFETFPEFEWLSNFFARPELSHGATKISIIDSVQGSLKRRGEFSGACDDFVATLTSRAPEVKTRLIITTYTQTWGIDRTAVDKLGLYFDIDPNFFRRHFYYYFIRVEHAYVEKLSVDQSRETDTIAQEIDELSSDKQSKFHFAFTRSYDMMSGYLYRDPVTQDTTVLIWVRYRPNTHLAIPQKARPSVHEYPEIIKASCLPDAASSYLANLLNMTEEQVSAGDKDTCIFFYPYARHILRRLYGDFMQDFNTHRLALIDQDRKTQEDNFGQLLFHFEGISLLYEEIEKIVRSLDDGDGITRSLFENLRHDCSLLKRRFEESHTRFQMMKNDYLLEHQMQEMELSAQSALSVTRLTKLAFIFIPLSFTTSFFGMNVQELGPDTRIWLFFVVAASIFVCCLIPLIPAIVLSFARSRMRTNFVIVRELASQHSLKVAFFYFLFRLMFTSDICHLLFEVVDKVILRPKTKFWMEKTLKTRPAKDILEKQGYSKDFTHFWSEKAKEIYDSVRKRHYETHHEGGGSASKQVV